MVQLTTVLAPRRSVSFKLKAYLALTKPRIIELLLVTTLPTMVVAAKGIPRWWLIVATLVGGSLSAGGANTANMVVDRDIDAVMHRTQHRPLVTGAVSPAAATVFAVALEAAAFVLLWRAVNLYSALLALGAALFYVFVYSIWLKRRSTQNIVIGGAAGAAPVLIGWTAVTDHLAWPAIALFAMIVIWTPSHFWALAVRYQDDYKAASVPMLPVVAPFDHVSRQIILYSVALVASSFVFGVVDHSGWIYWSAAGLAGAVYLADAFRLRREHGTPKSAMRLFAYSITYITVVFAAMAVDVLVRYR
ncbi:MAG TPA: heme o synthase [Acidimicrobiales bacterium]|nr:heme o synthase [Acidimicrobiales bacterium]